MEAFFKFSYKSLPWKTAIIFLITFMLNSCMIPNYTQSIKLNEGRPNEEGHFKPKNLSIIAGGPISIRVFIENFYSLFEGELTNDSIISSLHYVGKNSGYETVNVSKYATPESDGYLVFSSLDSAKVSLAKLKYEVLTPVAPAGIINTGVYGNQYKTKVLVEYFSKNNFIDAVWYCELILDFDFGDMTKFPELINLVKKDLEKNSIIFN